MLAEGNDMSLNVADGHIIGRAAVEHLIPAVPVISSLPCGDGDSLAVSARSGGGRFRFQVQVLDLLLQSRQLLVLRLGLLLPLLLAVSGGGGMVDALELLVEGGQIGKAAVGGNAGHGFLAAHQLLYRVVEPHTVDKIREIAAHTPLEEPREGRGGQIHLFRQLAQTDLLPEVLADIADNGLKPFFVSGRPNRLGLGQGTLELLHQEIQQGIDIAVAQRGRFFPGAHIAQQQLAHHAAHLAIGMVGIRGGVAVKQQPFRRNLMEQRAANVDLKKGQLPVSLQRMGIVAVDDQNIILLHHKRTPVLCYIQLSLHEIKQLQLLMEVQRLIHPMQERGIDFGWCLFLVRHAPMPPVKRSQEHDISPCAFISLSLFRPFDYSIPFSDEQQGRNLTYSHFRAGAYRSGRPGRF